jgi:hypothetical protein
MNEKQIELGDALIVTHSRAPVTVVAIDEDCIQVRYDNGLTDTFQLSELEQPLRT